MKNIISITIFLLISNFVLGQQEQQYTQWMLYKLGINPAYAGANDAPCISTLVRSQWIGVDGAPQTQLVTFSMPLLNKRIGLGASVLRNTIGITENYTVEADYAYRLRLGRGFLALGLSGSVRLFRNDFSEVRATEPKESDGSIPVGLQSRYIPNFGAGIYYNSANFFFGVSAPRLLENDIDLADMDDGTISKEIRHIYAMGGFIIPINDNIKLQPQVLMKYVSGAPFDADINFNFIFMDKFTAGLSYRIGGSKRSGAGESASLLFAAQVTESILFGLSYDANLSDFRNYNSGSIEGTVRYCIGGKSQGEEFTNPRFF